MKRALFIVLSLPGCATTNWQQMTPQQSAALMDAGIKLLNQSNYYTVQPAATPAPRTVCVPSSNGATHCTVYHSNGQFAYTYVCVTQANGQTFCQ